MDFETLVHTRKSVRGFAKKPVPREVLRAKVTGWASLFAAKEQARARGYPERAPALMAC